MYIPIKTQWGARNYGGTSMYPNVTSIHSEDLFTMCECRVLDDVYNGVPSIIKMDVEENELFVLYGALQTLERCGYPPIVFESNTGENTPLFDYLRNVLKYNVIHISGCANMYLATRN